MITAEIVEAGITRRSTNMERPGRPLWTSSCRSLEGSTITDSINPKSILFLGLVHGGIMRYHPKVLVLPAKIRMGLRMPERQALGPSDEAEHGISRETLGYTILEACEPSAIRPLPGRERLVRGQSQGDRCNKTQRHFATESGSLFQP